MLTRLVNQFKFYLEKRILQGAHYHLLIMAILIILVSLVAGALAFLLTPAFKWCGEGVWWAFLRLTDPGYLGDDEGYTLCLDL